VLKTARRLKLGRNATHSFESTAFYQHAGSCKRMTRTYHTGAYIVLSSDIARGDFVRWRFFTIQELNPSKKLKGV
jgi:hypothetical protein